MGKYAKTEIHDFYCLNCGNKGIELPRKRGQKKEKFHRKKMYCFHCHNTVNHIECKTIEEVAQFKEEFKQGVYKDEAQESMAFIQKENSFEQKLFG